MTRRLDHGRRTGLCASVASAVIALVLGAASARADDAPQPFALHGQFTSVSQYHPSFRSAFQGPNSLDPGSRGDTTNDVTLYLGVRPWGGAEIWLDPEVDQGFGLSNTLGVAGFTSGEAYKVGNSTPYFRLQRWFLRQTVDLGGASKKVDPDLNQLGGSQSENRLVFTLGKFSAVDIFDTNKYAHDARNDFLNWTIIDTGTYDYAADAWGYTYGAAAEWYQGNWTTRLGLFDLSKIPNNKKLDPTFRQYQVDAELEHRHKLWGQGGAVRVTAFLTRGRMGDLSAAVDQAVLSGQPADIAATRRFSSRVGVSATIEQQVRDDLGLFVRAGWAQGDSEAFEFTDVDETVSAGLSLNGKRWGRDGDTVGLAGVVNQASSQRLAFFNAGGLGILAGDGQLPHSGPEQILETYYSLALFKVAHLTFDYQFVANPAYNPGRGPVSVFGARLHAQF